MWCLSLLRIPGFGGSDEAVAAEKVLDCFDQGDADGMKTCTSQALFTYLDNEVSEKEFHSENKDISSIVTRKSTSKLALLPRLISLFS